MTPPPDTVDVRTASPSDTIEAFCTACGIEFGYTSLSEIGTATCPDCRAPLTYKAVCPNCLRDFLIEREFIGTESKCPLCKATATMTLLKAWEPQKPHPRDTDQEHKGAIKEAALIGVFGISGCLLHSIMTALPIALAALIVIMVLRGCS